MRDGERRTIAVEPIVDGPDRRIGIEIWTKEEYAPASPGAALLEAAIFPARYARYILRGFAEMASGRQKAELSGPIGIVKVTRRQVNQGVRNALQIIAILCVYFGLQIGVLDGARLFAFVARRRPRSPARELGEIVLEKQRMPASVILMLILLGLVAAEATLTDHALDWERIVFSAALAYGLVTRHPAAWGVTQLMLVVMGAVCLLVPPSRWDLVIIVPAALLFNRRATRRWFGLDCPVCEGGAARAVLGERRSFGCLRCGSAWTVREATN